MQIHSTYITDRHDKTHFKDNRKLREKVVIHFNLNREDN